MASVTLDSRIHPVSKLIQTTIKTPLGPLAGNYLEAEDAGFYRASIDGKQTSVYAYFNVKPTIKQYNFNIPIFYDVGNTGLSFWDGAVNTRLTLNYKGLSISSDSLDTVYRVGDLCNSTDGLTIYSTKQWTDATITGIVFNTQGGISFQTTTNYRTDELIPRPVITGNRNSPILSDSGENTRLEVIVNCYYKSDSWECAAATCKWGEKISATYFGTEDRIRLVGKLYRLTSKDKVETYLDDLAIPTAPEGHDTDIVVFRDTTSSSVKEDKEAVFRKVTYKFKNWNTRSDGSGTTYGSGGKPLSTSTFTTNTVLYAQWEATTSTTHRVPSDWTTDKLERLSDTPVLTATLTCYDRSTIIDTCEARKYELKSMKLKQWVGNDGSRILPGDLVGGASTYTAEFEIDPTSESQYEWENNTVVPAIPEDRRGWTYLGLSALKDSETADHLPGEELTIEQTQVLHAIWKANGAAKVFTETGWKTYQIYIYNNEGEWKLYMPKIYTEENGWNNIYI